MANETVTAEESKELQKLRKTVKKHEKTLAEKKAIIVERNAIFDRAFHLMDELTRAVESHDAGAKEGYAAVCREFLDKYRAGLPVIG